MGQRSDYTSLKKVLTRFLILGRVDENSDYAAFGQSNNHGSIHCSLKGFTLVQRVLTGLGPGQPPIRKMPVVFPRDKAAGSTI